MAISNGMKIFITGITFCVVVAALAVDAKFLLVGGVFCVIGCLLIWLNQ